MQLPRAHAVLVCRSQVGCHSESSRSYSLRLHTGFQQDFPNAAIRNENGGTRALLPRTPGRSPFSSSITWPETLKPSLCCLQRGVLCYKPSDTSLLKSGQSKKLYQVWIVTYSMWLLAFIFFFFLFIEVPGPGCGSVFLIKYAHYASLSLAFYFKD